MILKFHTIRYATRISNVFQYNRSNNNSNIIRSYDYQSYFVLLSKQLHPNIRSKACYSTIVLNTPNNTIATQRDDSILDNIPLYTNNVLFRKHRDRIAQQLLLEFDQRVFDGVLLCRNKYHTSDTATKQQQYHHHHDIPNVTLVWSNRLRTTAGRAHLSTIVPKQQQTTKSKKGKFISKPQQLSHHQYYYYNDIGHRRVAKIELSTKVVDDIYRLQSTLLHELCHVAAWLMDNIIRPPHGICFQKWVHHASIRIPSISITIRHNFQIHYKYIWTCSNPSCTVKRIGRHCRRSINIQRHVCGKCHSPLQLMTSPIDHGVNHNSNDSLGSIYPTNTKTTIPTTQRVGRTLNDYQRFIQRHMKIIRQQLVQQQQKRKQKIRPTTTKIKTITTENKVVQLSSKQNQKIKHRASKISSQTIMKECAKLWQQMKHQKSKGKKQPMGINSKTKTLPKGRK